MAMVTVLDPTAPPKHDSEGAGPDAAVEEGDAIDLEHRSLG